MDHSYQYQSHIQEIPRIRKDLEFLKQEWEFPDSEMRQLQLIIEELFSNIIRYAFRDKNEHLVEIGLTREDDKIIIHICDDGVPFNPLEYDTELPDDPATSDIGGMGLSLIKAFSSHLSYNRMSGKNHLYITKKSGSK
jgi:anti-sigma regulatory factor (Ser/Thr protein kinase)